MMLAGCQAGEKEPGPPPPVAVQWRALTLPMPEGALGRIMVRDVVACGGGWYLVGAIGSGDDETRPAAWTSADGESWQAVRLTPKTYYGRRNVLHSVACKDGRPAVVGWKAGGAHGNPRVSTWLQLPDGSLDEVLAGFELYGGPQAVNVSRMAAGPGGFMMAGNRFSGAAAWISPDGAAFRIMERAPELASDGRGDTWAVDVTATPSGWIMVGGIIGPGRTDRDPMAWTSLDGFTWRRISGPSSRDYEEFHRVTSAGGVAYAVGLRGKHFGAWELKGDQWTPAGVFGVLDAKSSGSVRSLTVAGGGNLLAVVSDGRTHGLWLSPDARSWRALQAPAEMPSASGRTVSAATFARRVILLIDDGAAGRVWSADLSVTF